MRIRTSALIAALGVALMLGPVVARAAGNVTLQETGSSLLYPLFNIWVPVYTRFHPNIRITPQSTGSGTGISQAIAGIVQIGASDAYMSNTLVKKHPLLNIPLCISMQMVNYNLPGGLNKIHLRLSGPVLAGIYSGKIRYWDDSAITALNPGRHLPHHVIIPVHRTDGSGDTFIFTQYLSFSDQAWNNSVSYGTTVSWPGVPGGIGAEGNPGMVSAVQDNLYSVAYIGTSFEDQTNKRGIGLAALKNRAGNFVLPSVRTAKAAAAAKISSTPKDERISLIFAPGADAYPIINYEYALVSSQQPNADLASALKTFFTWAMSPHGGSSPYFMRKVHFVPLPPQVAKLSAAQIGQIR